MTYDVNAVKKYLEVIKRSVELIEKELLSAECVCNKIAENVDSWVCKVHGEIARSRQISKQETNLYKQIEKLKEPEIDVIEEEKQNYLLARKKHIEDLLSIDSWPEAVPKNLLAEPTEQGQINRANAILCSMIESNSQGFHNIDFLDFGCGDGYMTNQMAKMGANSYGYDIIANPLWEKFDKVKFYNDIPNSTYDIILMYDVLDHCDNPVEVMKIVNKLLRPSGKVYVRCHPWLSRHGAHIYKTGLNKAFIQLFLSYDELNSVGHAPPFFVRQEKQPLEAYKSWFNSFEYKEREHKKPVPEFFFVQAFKDLLINEQKLDADIRDKFFKDMELEFVDYTLTKKLK